MKHVVDELEAQGRHSADATKPATQYPALPEGSPWSTQNAVEPPLGFSVEDLEPVGAAHEIAASLATSSEPGEIAQGMKSVAVRHPATEALEPPGSDPPRPNPNLKMRRLT